MSQESQVFDANCMKRQRDHHRVMNEDHYIDQNAEKEKEDEN